MAKKWYIKHVDVEQSDNGLAYFGPFDDFEIEFRINDVVADMFAGSGNVEIVKLPFWKRWRKFINSREWWLKELDNMEQFSGRNVRHV